MTKMNLTLLKIFLLFFFLQTTHIITAQVTVNNTNSAILDVQSSNKGFLPPCMNSAQRRAILNPAAGLIVYDTDRQTPYFYNGNFWKPMISEVSAPAASLAGVDANDGASGDGFGANVSIYGNYAIASAYRDDIGANTNQGSAYIFKFENGSWMQMQKLVASDGQAYDEFGGGVALDSNFAFVGAVFADVNGAADQGCVYAFKLENGIWVQKQKIISVNAAAGDLFGGSVSCYNNIVAITASKDDIGFNNDQGSAYIFKLDSATGTWSEVQKLTANDGTAGDTFGYCISLDSNKVIIGAVFDDVNGLSQKGFTYIFTMQSGNWFQTVKLASTDGASQDYFGRSVAIQGNYALVGSYFSDVTLTNQGACYFFKLENGTWTQKQKIVAADPTSNAYFGAPVGFKSNYAVIGANGVSSLTGAAYVFQLNISTSTMTQIQKITSADGAFNDNFGYAAAIYNFNIIIGAFGKSSERGKIYFRAVD